MSNFILDDTYLALFCSVCVHSLWRFCVYFLKLGAVGVLAGSGSGTFSNGVGTSAGIFNPRSITLDSMGTLYVVDMGNRIRSISTSGLKNIK